jgi:leader peptidase (prepilin peptidase)/N-methyltransferase
VTSAAALAVFLQNNPSLFAFLAGLLGLIVGSFLNVVIYRLPIILERNWKRQCQEFLGKTKPGEDTTTPFNLVTPRSQCPDCGHAITALENIPLLSFLWLKGKCSACQKPISRRYPVVELLSAALSAFVAWYFGVHLTTPAALILTWALIALTFIDLDRQILPDAITLPFLWMGLAANYFDLFTDLHSAVLGAGLGYISLWLVFQVFKYITGKEGMGYGDFKLFAVFGAWLGWQVLPLIMLLASLVGAIVGIGFIVLRGHDRRIPIPFGPFLCSAAWIALLWGSEIIHAYLRLSKLTG